MRWGARRATVFGLVSLVVGAVACKSSYGEAPAAPAAPDGSVPTIDLPPDSGSSSSSGGGPGAPGVDAGDAGGDAALVGDPCPPCPASTSCLGSGCVSVDSIANSCSAPRDVTATTTAVMFLCPDGPTMTLDPMCNGGGTFHVGVLRLGAGNWTVAATGSNPFLATDSCTNFASCFGASDTVSHAFPGLGMVLVGTTNTLTACETMSLTVTQD